MCCHTPIYMSEWERPLSLFSLHYPSSFSPSLCVCVCVCVCLCVLLFHLPPQGLLESAMFVTANYLYISATTAFKLITAVLTGFGLASYLSSPKESQTGFSYITLRVCLSSMLFANLCLDVSPSLLREYYWAVIMSLVPMVLGATFSLLLRRLVPEEWRVLLVLGSTFQNGLVFPLSVVSSIKGVAWLGEEEIRHCQQYVFLYNLTCALGLWSIGNAMVRHFKQKLILKQEDELMEAQYQQLALVQEQSETKRRRRSSSTARKKVTPSSPSEVSAATRDKAPPLSPSAVNSVNVSAVAMPSMTSAPPPRTGAGTAGPPHASASTLTIELPNTRQQREGDDGGNNGEGEHNDGDDNEGEGPLPGVLSATGRAGTLVSSPSVLTTRSASESLTWYRPPLHKNRPISVTKFERFMHAREAVGSTSSAPVLLRGESALYSKQSTSSATRSMPQWVSEYPEDEDGAASAATYSRSSSASSSTPNRAEVSQTAPALPGGGARTPTATSCDAATPVRAQTAQTQRSRSPQKHTEPVPHKDPRHPREAQEHPHSPHYRHHRAHDVRVESNELSEDVLGAMNAISAAAAAGAYSSSAGVTVSASTNVGFGGDAHDAAGQPSLSTGSRRLTSADSATMDVDLHLRDRPLEYRVRRALRITYDAICTPPVWMTLLAIFISLTPPLRWCAETLAGQTILHGIALVGTACVPLQLLTLGITLSTSRGVPDRPVRDQATAPILMPVMAAYVSPPPAPAPPVPPSKPQPEMPRKVKQDPEAPIQYRPSDLLNAQPAFDIFAEGTTSQGQANTTTTDSTSDTVAARSTTMADDITVVVAEQRHTHLPVPGWLAAVQRRWNSIPVFTRFSALVLFLRLLFLPALCIGLVDVLVRLRIMPHDRPFVISILIGVSAPAAVNSALVCTMNQYHSEQYARMILMMYAVASVTSTLWLAVSITYAGSLTPPRSPPLTPS